MPIAILSKLPALIALSSIHLRILIKNLILVSLVAEDAQTAPGIAHIYSYRQSPICIAQPIRTQSVEEYAINNNNNITQINDMIKCFYQMAASDQFIKQRRNAHSRCRLSMHKANAAFEISLFRIIIY